VQHHPASFTVNGNTLPLQPWSLSTNSPGPSQPSILVGDKWLVLSSTSLRPNKSSQYPADKRHLAAILFIFQGHAKHS